MLGLPIGEHRADLVYGPKITERDAYYSMSEIESASRKGTITIAWLTPPLLRHAPTRLYDKLLDSRQFAHHAQHPSTLVYPLGETRSWGKLAYGDYLRLPSAMV